MSLAKIVSTLFLATLFSSNLSAQTKTLKMYTTLGKFLNGIEANAIFNGPEIESSHRVGVIDSLAKGTLSLQADDSDGKVNSSVLYFQNNAGIEANLGDNSLSVYWDLFNTSTNLKKGTEDYSFSAARLDQVQNFYFFYKGTKSIGRTGYKLEGLLAYRLSDTFFIMYSSINHKKENRLIPEIQYHQKKWMLGIQYVMDPDKNPLLLTIRYNL